MAGSGNPFRPGVGTRPLLLAGRDEEIEEFETSLRNAPDIPGNLKVTGLRGVGKTVLLGEFAIKAQADGWVTVGLEIEPQHNSDIALTAAIGQACQIAVASLSLAERAKVGIDRFRGLVKRLTLSHGEVSLNVDLGRRTDERPLAEVLDAAMDCAVDAGKRGVAVLLDEAHLLRDDTAQNGEHPVTMILTAVSGLQKRGRPIVLVLCGLPTLRANLQRARTYTERMFLGVEVDALRDAEAKEAFLGPLDGTVMEVDEDVVEAVLERADGYPYFIQLWGAELWDQAIQGGTSRITIAVYRARRFKVAKRLARDFYAPRMELLSPTLQEMMWTCGRCVEYPPLRLSEITELSYRTRANASQLMARLVDAGALYRTRPGEFEYSAPGFHGYLLQRRVEQGS